jgi:hypothetical protein
LAILSCIGPRDFSNSFFYSPSRLRTCDLNHSFCFLHRIQLSHPFFSSQSISDESGWSGKSKLVLKQCSSVFLFLKIFKIEYENNKNKIISNVKFALTTLTFFDFCDVLQIILRILITMIMDIFCCIIQYRAYCDHTFIFANNALERNL